MVMILVPAGEFLMGDDRSAATHERPEHIVYLDDYWIDRMEVTNAQYRPCVEAGVCPEPKSWTKPDLSGDNQPVLVPWEAAETYCDWVGGRLPTEAEWEKAIRGTDGRTWPWGNEFVADRGNLSGKGDGYGATAPVGSFPDDVSPYGLLDAAGNAAEWVADWYDAEYYARSPARNPTGPPSGQQKVHRAPIANAGGGPAKCRCTARFPVDPTWEHGLRCAATTPPSGATPAPVEATPTPKPVEATPTPVPPTPTPVAKATPIEHIATLDTLDSYRLRLMSRVQDEGAPEPFEMIMTMEWVREPPASRTVMSDSDGNVMMEMITIGDITWMKMGDTWMQMPPEQAEPEQEFDAEDILADLDMETDMTLVGEETVNGVHCKHYTVDTEFSIPLPRPEGADELPGLAERITGHVQGEVWVADQRGLPPVTIRGRTQTEMTFLTPTGEPTGEGTMVIYEERDLYDINEPITIEPPE
jgi:hypothetical protein